MRLVTHRLCSHACDVLQATGALLAVAKATAVPAAGAMGWETMALSRPSTWPRPAIPCTQLFRNLLPVRSRCTSKPCALWTVVDRLRSPTVGQIRGNSEFSTCSHNSALPQLDSRRSFAPHLRAEEQEEQWYVCASRTVELAASSECAPLLAASRQYLNNAPSWWFDLTLAAL